MSASVYVHAAYRADSRDIPTTLRGFYSKIRNIAISGLERVEPILARDYFTLRSQRPEFRDAIQKCFQDADSQHLKSLGLLTRWRRLDDAYEFQQGQIHTEFSEYANGTLGEAWYRIIQDQDGKMATRDVKR